MTFVLRVVLLELLLLGLMTWLLDRSLAPEEPSGTAIERAIDGLNLADSDLRRNLLAARAGLLKDYDPLVRDIDAMRRFSADLEHGPGEIGQRGHSLMAVVREKDSLLEQFKSQNAILQNALAAFDLLTARLTRTRIDPNLEKLVGGLASVVTHLSREPSQNVAAAARSWVTTLFSLDIAQDSAADALSLGEHARLLVDIIPQLDDVLRRLEAFSVIPQTATIRAEIAEERDRQRQASQRFHVALYAMAVLISAVLLRAGFGLRARTRALQDRIVTETAIAKASNLFVACFPEEIDDRLGGVLALLGNVYAADRAYLLTVSDRRAWLWCNTGVDPPVDWPASREDALLRVAHQSNGSFRRDAKDLPDGLADQLHREGITAISCAVLRRESALIGLLVFERSRASFEDGEREEITLDLIADVVGGALWRRDAFRSRADLERKLRQAQRLQRLGTFASGIAHNFNNVLGVISGQVEMAATATDAGPVVARHVKEIAEASQHARDITGQILDYGRSNRGSPQVAQVGAIMASAVRQAEVATAGRVDIALVDKVRDGSVLADPAQLQQVFVNVVQNAVQASPASASVHVTLESCSSPGRRVSHGAVDAGTFVHVTVADRGRGMTAAEQAQMFEPFFTTRGEGTGLGLATARDTVDEVGGAFDVRSAPGEGTTIEIWLPQLEDVSQAVTVSGAVLLLGADLKSVQRDEDLLAALGYEPVGFADVAQALRAIEADAHRFDTMVIEESVLRTADGTGRRLIAAARSRPEPLPIVLSLSEGGAEMPADLAPGISAVLIRPWRSGTVVATLARVLRAAQAPSERSTSAAARVETPALM